MEQLSTPVTEIFTLILFLGSATFEAGAVFQGIILFKNKQSILKSVFTILLTRTITVVGAYFIWTFWILPIDIMWLFIFLPALLPELIFSPLLLKLFGNSITVRYRISEKDVRWC